MTKEFELKNITEITRVASNDRRLRLKFDWATQRDYLVQFETCNARESFCALLAVMHRPVLSMDEGEVDLSDFAVAYDVQVVTSTGLRRKRTLLLDRAHRAVYRVSNVGDATDLVVAGLEPIEPPGGDADGSASNAPPTQAKNKKKKKKKPKKKLPKFESRRVNQYTSIVAHAVDRRRIKLLFGRTLAPSRLWCARRTLTSVRGVGMCRPTDWRQGSGGGELGRVRPRVHLD